ncbi:hypothetical protein KCU81_g1532, partial [Aureobasidium melanogenum]
MMYRKEREKTEVDRLAQTQLERQKIRQASKLEQFCDYNHKIAYWKARTQRHGSTGQWLTRTDEFKRWIAGSDPNVFWFTGILGSGKTVMTAFVVEQLSAKPTQNFEKLVYFFCQYDNETSLKATTVLRSIIRQLLDQEDRIFTEHESKIDALLDNLYDLSLLESLFTNIINCLKSITVIIDGIDECSNSEMKLLIKTLRSLMLREPSGLKLCLSGDDRITDIITSSLTPSFVVNTHKPEADTDLQELIQQLVTVKREDEDLVATDPSLYQEIVDILCTASQGMVLWVKFQLEEICCQKTDESIRKALNHLPKDLSETYDRLLSRIVEEGSDEVCNKIFRFMAAAKRPLSPEELGEAISVQPCQPYFMPERLLNDINGIVRWCHGLITFDDLDETLQFAHSSVKSFLCSPDTERIAHSDFHFQEHEADRQFGEICVTYLSFNDFKTQAVKYSRSGTALNPMAMASHALRTEPSSIVLNQAQNMISRRAKSASASSRLFFPQTKGSKSQMIAKDYQLFQYASESWLLHTTEFSPEQGHLWSLFQTLARDRYGIPSNFDASNPLRNSAPGVKRLSDDMFIHRHHALFRFCCKDEKGLRWTLSEILRRKSFSFLRLLLPLANQPGDLWLEAVMSVEDSDLSVFRRDTGIEWIQKLTLKQRSSMLRNVIEMGPNGLLGVSAALVNFGIDPWYKSGSQTTLLEKLIYAPNDELLKTVCEAMVDSHADFERDIASNGRTALHVAAVARRHIAVKILLDHGADVDTVDCDGRTALHLAIKGEALAMEIVVLNTVSQLLSAGVSLHVRDCHGKVALDYASPDLEQTLHERFAKHKKFFAQPPLSPTYLECSDAIHGS